MLEQQLRSINHLSEVNGANHKPQAHSGFFLLLAGRTALVFFFVLFVVCSSLCFRVKTKWLCGGDKIPSMWDRFSEREAWALTVLRLRCWIPGYASFSVSSHEELSCSPAEGFNQTLAECVEASLCHRDASLKY